MEIDFSWYKRSFAPAFEMSLDKQIVFVPLGVTSSGTKDAWENKL